MYKLNISTQQNKQIIDITNDIEGLIPKDKVEIQICYLFIKHTTAAITTADLDPGTDLDMLDAFSEMMPRLHYRHPHNPSHVVDHILSSIIGASPEFPTFSNQGCN